MISFEPLWETMKKKGYTTYTLIYKLGFSTSLIAKLKHNKNVQLTTIERLCEVLDCNIEDVVRFQKD